MDIKAKRQRIEEIQNKLDEFSTSDSYTPEEVETINALSSEFEGLKSDIETFDKLQNINKVANTGVRKTSVASSVSVVKDVMDKKPNGGFEHKGEFYQAVKNAATGNIDKRLSVLNQQVEKGGEDGGFLVPADIRSEVQKKIEGDESLLSRTKQFSTSGNHLVLPVHENAPWDSNGYQAYWDGETQASTATKENFREMSLRLHKLTAMVKVSEELLEDAPALEGFINMVAPDAIVHKVNNAIIDGDAVGKPEGILQSGFTKSVAKESGQAAGTVLFENIVKMQSSLLPASFGRSVWLINPQVSEQLKLMAFDAGATSKVPAYMPPSGLDVAPYGTLMGRPIMPMMGAMKALGTNGDIILADFNYYISALKGAGVKSEVSTHVYFDQGLTAFRFTFRVAGQCPYKAPVITEYGNYSMSSFVTLATRA